MTISVDAIPLGLAAVVGIGLALVLLRYGADRSAHRALAAFLGLHGTLNLVRFAEAFAAAPATLAVLHAYRGYFGLSDGLMLLALLAVYPAPRSWLPKWATRLWPYLAVLVAFDLAYLVDHDLTGLALADFVLDGAYAAVPLVLARDAFGRDRRDDWRSVGLMAIGIPLYFLHLAAAQVAAVAGNPDGFDLFYVPLALARSGLFAGFLLYFLRLAGRTTHEKRPLARFGVLLLFAPVVTGVSTAFLGAGWFLVWLALWFLATPTLVAYALLRHRLLSIDLGLRWTISKSTVTAAFVAVFFVASEAAQQFLGDTLGSTYVGIAAAGALVFAIAPLQRAAERLAAQAVPVSGAPAAVEAPASGTVPPEDLFLNAVRVAMRDQRLTREEEAHLYRLAAGLGIDAGRAHDLLVQAELETAEASRGAA